MKKIITLALMVAASSTSVFAQVSNFTGPSAGVNMNTVSTTTKLTADGSAAFDGFGQQSLGTSLQAAYGIALSNDTVVSIGGTYALNKDRAGNLEINGDQMQFKNKNQMSLYLEPGYLVSNTTLAYGKVSYESAKMTVSVTGADGDSQKVNGYGYGFGIRTMLDKNLSLQVEVKQVKYGAENWADDGSSKFKSSATLGTIGLGYKF